MNEPEEPERTVVFPAMPEVTFARRQLHLIVVVDCSGSMTGDKMASLNYAMRSLVPALRDVAEDNPETDLRLRVLAFSTGTRWHEPGPTPIDAFVWHDLVAGGETDMGAALREVGGVLTPEEMSGRQLPPVVVLISDGFPSDDFEAGLAALMAAPYGGKSVRVAVAIGQDADPDVLDAFIGNPEFRPLRANNAQDLVARIRWATTAVVKAVSSPTTDPRPLASLGERAAIEIDATSDVLW
jgi:uncharacterized protein YegL